MKQLAAIISDTGIHFPTAAAPVTAAAIASSTDFATATTKKKTIQTTE